MTSDEGHRHAERFDFEMARNTAVYKCQRVQGGAPILEVVHDEDGDWQFLCGGDHGDESGDRPVISCLECLVADDPSVNDVADLCCDETAVRATVGGAWTRHDGTEDKVRAGVEEHGWYVISVGRGARDDEPGFAYTIGLHRTFGHPELICIGLRAEVMHAMFAECVRMIRAGQAPPVGAPFADVIADYLVQLREVRAPSSYEQLGYARWFHGGRDFPVLQLVWPDKQGLFPGERGANPIMATQQPLLP